MENRQRELVLRIQSTCDGLAPFAWGLTRNVEDRDDLLQETFLKAFIKRSSLHPKTDLKAWLYTIMRNTFISHYHRRIRHGVVRSLTQEREQGVQSTGTPAQNQGVGNLVMDDIQSAMETLEKQHFTPLAMYLGGFCYREIAETLHLPMGTVKNRIHLARRMLKKRLTSYRFRRLL